MPKFLKFRVYRRSLRTSAVYRECQLALLKNEIDYKKKIQWRLAEHTRRCEERLKAAISFLDYIHAKQFIEKIINVYKSNIIGYS